MAALNRLLKALKVDSYLELNTEERDTYRKLETALNGRRLTDEDTQNFLRAELEDVLQKLPKTHPKDPDMTFLLVKLEFLRKVEGFLNIPNVEKRMAQETVERMIHTM